MMKLKMVLVVFALSTFAVAQHGRPAGAGSGMGQGSSMGHSSSMGSSMSSNNGASGQPSMAAASGKTASDLLSQNTTLSSNLEKLLPSGTTAQKACDGFKNLGQCVAAIHISNNLGIAFTDLKSKMTGDGSESLGKAITDLKPTANVKAESKKANKQAQQDLQSNS